MEKKEVWVKGVLEENGDVLIHLGNDGYHRIIEDYTDDVVVKRDELIDKIMKEIDEDSISHFDYDERFVMLSDIKNALEIHLK